MRSRPRWPGTRDGDDVIASFVLYFALLLALAGLAMLFSRRTRRGGVAIKRRAEA